MRVLVTGASGFVGSHTVKALVEAGHEVRAAARSIDRIRQALEPLGCAGAVQLITADITSEAQVRTALDGCDAVVHAAAVYSHDARRRKEMLVANPAGTELVLGLAHEKRLDPIVHVSSYAALLPATGPLTVDSPVGDPPVPYARSKARSDLIARRLQERGAPVTIVYPGMIWGPEDPTSGESTLLARAMLGNSLRNGIPGAVLVVDVRDVAAVHAAVLRPGLGPRRYFAVAETVALVDLQRMVRQAAGLGPPRGMLPAAMVTLTGRAADLVQRLLRRRLPLDYEGPWTALHCPTVDATATTRGLGVAFRPAAQTILDTVRWLRTTEPAGQARPAGPHTNKHGAQVRPPGA